jgi:hypothetical protein
MMHGKLSFFVLKSYLPPENVDKIIDRFVASKGGYNVDWIISKAG